MAKFPTITNARSTRADCSGIDFAIFVANNYIRFYARRVTFGNYNLAFPTPRRNDVASPRSVSRARGAHLHRTNENSKRIRLRRSIATYGTDDPRRIGGDLGRERRGEGVLFLAAQRDSLPPRSISSDRKRDVNR